MKRKNSDRAAAYQRAEAELFSGEELLWVGQPKSRHIHLGRTAVGGRAVLLSLIAGIQILLLLGGAFFALFSSSTSTTSGTVTSTQEVPWLLIAIILSGLMAGMAAAGFRLFRHWTGKQTIYAITDRRMLIISGDVVRSDGERDIEFIKRKMHRDGTGDIIYRREFQMSSGFYGNMVAPQKHTTHVGFFGISDPHYVEELMLDTFRPDAYSGKRKYDEPVWDEAEDLLADDIFANDDLLEELDDLLSSSS